MSNDEHTMDTYAQPTPHKRALVLASLCSLAIGIGAGFVGTQAGSSDTATAAISNGAHQVGGEMSHIADLGEFTVNLRNSASGRMLQMNISVEVTAHELESVTTKHAELRDAVLMLSSDYTLPELDGLDNRMAFRDEIQTRLNGVLAPTSVNRVYFTNFVVQ